MTKFVAIKEIIGSDFNARGVCLSEGPVVKYGIYIALLFIAFFLLAGCKHQAATPPNSNRQSPAASSSQLHGLIDINSASKEELESLQGIGEAYAQRIIDHRPYREKNDLVRLKIIPESTYHAVSDKIIAHQKQ